ncbi:MAG: vancomycin resistance protein, partial [Crocinitomicaceae bacterium]
DFYLEFWLDDTHLNGRLSCNRSLDRKYQIEERNHIFQQQTWGGYTRHNQIFQLEYDLEDNLLSERLIVENHAIMMYPPFLNEKNRS